MSNIIPFPENLENAHFDKFLIDNHDNPELPLLVYDYLCEQIKMTRHCLAEVSPKTYEKIEGAVNGLIDRAVKNGIINTPYRLINRQVQFQ